jgi:hypothetical protein
MITDVMERLLAELRSAGDEHTAYASTTVPGGGEADLIDVLVQTPGSLVPVALWDGEGFPTTPDDSDFADVASCARAEDGSIVARFEEVREDEDGEPYELVRIIVAFRPDGLAVTVNRYVEPRPDAPVEPWAFESLQALAQAPDWRARP